MLRSFARINPAKIFFPLLGVLVVRVTLSVISNYPRYLPPDFTSDFLHDREADFLGSYPWPFYIHIASGPISLLLGLLLVSTGFRSRSPGWHRMLGRFQVVLVLLFVAPSGLWMAFHAEAGAFAGAGLAALAILTEICTAMGAGLAMLRRYREHRIWMMRSYLLLCSAVVIRMIGGLALTLELTAWWIAPFAPWFSWVAPLVCFEVWERFATRRHRRLSDRVKSHGSVGGLPVV